MQRQPSLRTLLGVRPLPRLRQVEWRVSQTTYSRFWDLLEQIDEAESQGDLDRVAALHDDVRALPGYPVTNNPDRDVIIPVVTTLRSR